MTIDMNLAKTGVSFNIKESNYPKKDLLNILLQNKNLLEISNDDNYLGKTELNVLKNHIKENIKATLEDTEITVHFGKGSNKIKKQNFRFDDPHFYQAEYIKFTRFNMKQGVKDPEKKLSVLKRHMITELIRCKNLELCVFNVANFDPNQEFLYKAHMDALKIWHKDCDFFQHKPSKYASHWALFSGLALGMVLLVASLVSFPLLGMSAGFKLMMASSFTFMAASSFENWRQRFLFQAGNKQLLALRDGARIEDPSIKDSLITGHASKEWKGYFKSYLNFKTYTPNNYRAYAAGLYTGVNNLNVQKDAIKKLSA